MITKLDLLRSLLRRSQEVPCKSLALLEQLAMNKALALRGAPVFQTTLL